MLFLNLSLMQSLPLESSIIKVSRKLVLIFMMQDNNQIGVVLFCIVYFISTGIYLKIILL
ncbi:MAG: DUF1158 family protein [Desulfovibrionaceae bacterium]|nr:DUF1158 family protein [Desulfovibrionaceae bacterium]